METVEPGLDGNYIFDYAISGGGAFDDVAAWKMGANFDLPLRSQYVTALPLKMSDSFFSINAPNVQITTVKTISDAVVRGEVSATPLDPLINKIFVIRLQEFSGKATTARISLPVRIKSASIMNLTEDKILAPVSQPVPLTVNLKPFETLTIKIEIE
jgi:alpha-mannosidase